MLRSIRSLTGLKLRAEDGEFGKTKDFYFDDQTWTIRYLVAATGTWLPGRMVLISPHVAGMPDPKNHVVPVAMTKQQIQDSPSIDTDKPVSRQFEREYYAHFGWPYYWHGPLLWGTGPVPVVGRSPAENAWESRGLNNDQDIHLRSTQAVTGHHFQAVDGSIGHVDDFILDDETWSIRYLVVDTTNWWPGGQVLLSPEWINRVSWADKTVFTDLTRDAVKAAPKFDGQFPIGRDYEDRLFQHHDRPGYWTREEELLANYR